MNIDTPMAPPLLEELSASLVTTLQRIQCQGLNLAVVYTVQ